MLGTSVDSFQDGKVPAIAPLIGFLALGVSSGGAVCLRSVVYTDRVVGSTQGLMFQKPVLIE